MEEVQVIFITSNWPRWMWYPDLIRIMADTLWDLSGCLYLLPGTVLPAWFMATGLMAWLLWPWP